jgi:hypothetical protein
MDWLLIFFPKLQFGETPQAHAQAISQNLPYRFIRASKKNIYSFFRSEKSLSGSGGGDDEDAYMCCSIWEAIVVADDESDVSENFMRSFNTVGNVVD